MSSRRGSRSEEQARGLRGDWTSESHESTSKVLKLLALKRVVRGSVRIGVRNGRTITFKKFNFEKNKRDETFINFQTGLSKEEHTKPAIKCITTQTRIPVVNNTSFLAELSPFYGCPCFEIDSNMRWSYWCQDKLCTYRDTIDIVLMCSHTISQSWRGHSKSSTNSFPRRCCMVIWHFFMSYFWKVS